MNQEDLWKRFYAVVGGEPQLYALKQIVTYLLNLIADPKASSKDIARVVSSDPALSANVLKIVNSPIIGLRNKVSDLVLAISLLGYNQIRDIALEISVSQALNAKQNAQMMRLWKHSFYCGKISEIIAASLGRMAGEAFTMGLLHDIGKILLAYANYDAFETSLNNYRYQRGKVLHWQSEQATIGLTHAEIGGLACVRWQLPDLFYRVIWYHHVPPAGNSKSEEIYLSQVVHLADTLCWNLNHPSVNSVNPYSGKKPETLLSENLLAEVGLSKGRFQDVLTKVNESLKTTELIFNFMKSSN